MYHSDIYRTGDRVKEKQKKDKGKTWFAILGFISWKPMSGYDIKRLVDISLSYFWNVSYGQIYPTLKKLVAAGYATEESGTGSGERIRNVYRITSNGQTALDEWMSNPIDLSVQRDEMQLKLFLGGHRDRSTTITLIRNFREQQEERWSRLCVEYKETEPALKTGVLPDDLRWLEPESLEGAALRHSVREQTQIFLLSIRQGILKAEARIKWCDEALVCLEDLSFNQSTEGPTR